MGAVTGPMILPHEENVVSVEQASLLESRIKEMKKEISSIFDEFKFSLERHLLFRKDNVLYDPVLFLNNLRENVSKVVNKYFPDDMSRNQ